MHVHERTRTVAPLSARELPDWFLDVFLRWLRVCGLSVSLSCGAVLAFSEHPGNVPALLMGVATAMFALSIFRHDDGMMVIRGLAVFAIAAFTRGFVVVVFIGGHAPWTMEALQVVMWAHLAVFSVLTIRLLIRWGVVVRDPKNRW